MNYFYFIYTIIIQLLPSVGYKFWLLINKPKSDSYTNPSSSLSNNEKASLKLAIYSYVKLLLIIFNYIYQCELYLSII